MARKLGKTTDQRMAMLKNLTTDLLVYGRIETKLCGSQQKEDFQYDR